MDQAQGKDKSCVLVSFVRSNTEGKVGQLLKDWRRLNVLLTRAQRKLVLVGSASTLREDPMMRRMIDFCREKEWLVSYTE